MKLLLIFLLGVGILVGAIVLNLLGSRLGFTNWYEFFKDPSSTGALSYIWLLFLYPFGLGIIGYYIVKFVNL